MQKSIMGIIIPIVKNVMLKNKEHIMLKEKRNNKRVSGFDVS
jgi:hypothetical protein